MDPADEEFLLQHDEWMPDITKDIQKAIYDETNMQALDDALKRELVSKLGTFSHNHYFVVIYSSCDMEFYSPYDDDGGARALTKAREAVMRKLHLSGLTFFCCAVDSQSVAINYFDDDVKHGRKPLSVGDLAASSHHISCLCGSERVLLALQRTGNYMKGGKPIPEGGRLFDELKEEHARRCAGCPL